MIQVKIPSNNIEDRSYAIKVLFDCILGFEYEIVANTRTVTSLCWDDKSISFVDVFWRNGGISVENLPKVKYVKNDFTPEDDVPVLYGDGYILKNGKNIDCGIDVFASVFFMLTRWEESIIPKRDKYDRFIGKESIAYKNGFLHRPIVNEYVEMIWNMMQFLGYDGLRKARIFEVIPTHDIDRPYMKQRSLRVTKYIVKSLLSKDFKSIPIYLKNYFVDPYDTFQFLMDVSEKAGLQSRFYFMSADIGVDEYRKSPYMTSRYKRIVSDITERRHIVGFHPGFFSINSVQDWKKEKKMLTTFLNMIPVEGRQHYLRFDVPDTFSIWEKNDMLLDSTLSYHDVEGFRCGTGDIFPVYNFRERREYKLKERPLIIMDGTLYDYQGYSLAKISEILDYYLKVGEKYKMPITLLFHNSSFMGYFGKQLMEIYKNIIIKNSKKS